MHGPHHVAQKSTTTILPFMSAGSSFLSPYHPLSVSSGIGLPSIFWCSAQVSDSPQ